MNLKKRKRRKHKKQNKERDGWFHRVLEYIDMRCLKVKCIFSQQVYFAIAYSVGYRYVNKPQTQTI